ASRLPYPPHRRTHVRSDHSRTGSRDGPPGRIEVRVHTQRGQAVATVWGSALKTACGTTIPASAAGVRVGSLEGLAERSGTLAEGISDERRRCGFAGVPVC